ncbi:hypothetical protein Gotri_021333 [Gossypium trilobum]|uniref:Uncharacterized protein n=1 Tax=Gossypium trilobum TaxID=34281 RepID=A0A7J9DCY5_9ROSI|nr:hypothetical protein [Gossypium trilobum]
MEGKITSLGWNPFNGTIDASKDWLEKGKLDEMFIGIIAIGDKAWAPSLGILPSDLFEDDDNATPEENEQNAIDDVLMSDDVRHNIDGNLQTNELQPQP